MEIVISNIDYSEHVQRNLFELPISPGEVRVLHFGRGQIITIDNTSTPSVVASVLKPEGLVTRNASGDWITFQTEFVGAKPHIKNLLTVHRTQRPPDSERAKTTVQTTLPSRRKLHT